MLCFKMNLVNACIEICIDRIYVLFQANLSNILMCVLSHLLICTALRAHIIVVEALYKIKYYYYYYLSLSSKETFTFWS